MKRLCTTVAILTLSSSLALAQGGGGSSGGGSSGGGAAGSSSSGNAAAQSAAPSPSAGTTGSNAAAQQQSGAGTSATPGASVNGPNNSGGPVPGLAAPSAAPDLTVGRGPGVNPANPQDASRRGNPSDRTLPGARNPQDMKAFDNGVPQIIRPERR